MSAVARVPALFVIALFVTVLAGAEVRAQENLDQNKSGAKLFTESCVACHKSARGLAKGRMSFTLSYYLRQHYTSSSASAQTLTAYLQSVDTPPPGKAKRGVGKAQAKGAAANATTVRMPTGSISDERPLRPPAKVPAR